MGLQAVEWNPGRYLVSHAPKQFGATAFQSCDRQVIVEYIAIQEGSPSWGPSMGAICAFGSGKTERDIRDFTYYARNNHFAYWVFPPPSHIDITEHEEAQWATLERVDSALVGDVLAIRWAILIHGNLAIPEFSTGHGWRPLGTVGLRCCELGFPRGGNENFVSQ